MTENVGLVTDLNDDYRIELLTEDENAQHQTQNSEIEENETTANNEEKEDKQNFNSLNRNNALFNKNNSNMRSFRFSPVRADPFNPEFNAFYPMRRSKTDSFEFFDQNIFRFGLTRLILKIKESTQFFDEYLWSKPAFRLAMVFTVLISILGLLFKVINKPTKVPASPAIILILFLIFAYVVSFLENDETEDDQTNVNKSNITENLKSTLKDKFKFKTLTSLDSILSNIERLAPVVTRITCIVVTMYVTFQNITMNVGASSCVLIGIMIVQVSFHPMSAEHFNSVLTTLLSTLLLCIVCFKSSWGGELMSSWSNFIGKQEKLLSEALIASLHLENFNFKLFPESFYHVFYDPFYVGVAACFYQLGFHQFLFIMITQFGIYFFGVSTVVMGCIISNFFFDYAAFLLWMSPLLAVADDHQIFTIIVSTSCSLTLPLAFATANRFGIRFPFISAFGPINSCIGIMVCKCVFPSRKKIPSRLDLNLIRKREATDFFETIAVAVANSAKFIMLYFGGWALAGILDNLIIHLKSTIEALIDGSFLQKNIIDKAMYYLVLPLLYLLGFDEDDMETVSKFIFKNIFTYKTSTLDEFMHHVSLRWLSECWASASWLSVDYDGTDVFFKSTQEQTVYLHIKGTILSTKSEFLLLHLLMHFATVGNLFTFCAIMAILLPHRVVNIRSMMGSMFFAMILTLFMANLFLRIFYNETSTSLECVNEKKRPMCEQMMSKLKTFQYLNHFPNKY